MYNKRNVFRIVLFILIVVLVTFFSIYNKTKEPREDKNIVKNLKKEWIKEYPYRKYIHVKNFYKSFAPSAIDICLKYNIPPAAILAMAGVESGYGRGYVAKITGNILSLGAKKGEFELPALYLPSVLNFPDKVLYLKKNIQKYDKNHLVWKKRPSSFKRDYRQKNIAGTTNNLDYFKKHPEKKIEANLACITDFAKNWISVDKKLKPFVNARKMLNKQVRLHSKAILFDRGLNIKFINMIGGKKNSFNYRKTWPRKVTLIMDKVGLVELAKSLHVKGKNFDEVW